MIIGEMIHQTRSVTATSLARRREQGLKEAFRGVCILLAGWGSVIFISRTEMARGSILLSLLMISRTI